MILYESLSSFFQTWHLHDSWTLHSSFCFKCFEFAWARWWLDCELSISLLIDNTSFNELAHQAICHFPSLILLLKLENLLLKFLDLPQLYLFFGILPGSIFFLLSDLCLCSTTFAARLKHICRDSFGYWIKYWIMTTILNSETYN